MNLYKNMLVEWLNRPDHAVERILHIDQHSGELAAIDINKRTAKPFIQEIDYFLDAIDRNHAMELKNDPFAAFKLPEDSLSKKQINRRDRWWDILKDLIEDPRIYDPKFRGPKIAALLEKHDKLSKSGVYEQLRNFWQRGQMKDAFIPLWENCGGRGKERRCSERKRGIPSKKAKEDGKSTGVNVDAARKEKFKRGHTEFCNIYSVRDVSRAYEHVIGHYFHTGYELKDGAQVPVLPPKDEIPTLRQFRYWLGKEWDSNPTKALIALEGERAFALNHRGLSGNSTRMASGPGSVFQIDATIGDVYLVSSVWPRPIIGRPVIYLVKDVWSRLITGFAVVLEGPNWNGARLAIENMNENKVEFCARYGIEIQESWWPSHHLPDKIRADRGEYLSQNSDVLVNALGITIDTTAPYRPDWKAIVERHFRTLNIDMIKWLPGHVVIDRALGGPDYRLDAKLDIDQFRKLMIHCIVDYNYRKRLVHYRMDRYMIEDGVEPYPAELWKWGIRNRSGHLKQLRQDVVRRNLLPTGEAKITPSGIRFGDLYYTCQRAVDEDWSVRARVKGLKPVTVAYDPRNVGTIYLRMGGRELEPCHLTESEAERFPITDWYELDDFNERKKQADEEAKSDRLRAKVEVAAKVEAIVKEGEELTKAAHEGQSKRSLLKGIGEKRKKANEQDWQERNAQAPAVIPLKQPVDTTSDGKAGQEDDDDSYVPAPQFLDVMRRAGA